LEELIKTIETALPLVVEEWNTTSLYHFKLFYRKSFKDFFFNKQTQEKTKIVSPAVNEIFCEKMTLLSNKFSKDEINGRDFIWKCDDSDAVMLLESKISCENEKIIPLEGKITLSSGNVWTGNGYKKTNIHILIRFEMDENGYIISYFSSLVDLSHCISKWSEPTIKSNFSNLKFLTEDYDKINIIHGKIIKTNKKYLDFEMKKKV